jgi:hypothetical protein
MDLYVVVTHRQFNIWTLNQALIWNFSRSLAEYINEVLPNSKSAGGNATIIKEL